MGGGMRDFLDVLRSASDDEVGKSAHFWVTDEGLLESFLVGWCYAGMVDSNIQWKVRAWLGTELRECVWYGHFLTWAVMDWGCIPAGIASCVGAVQACLLGSSWIWIQVAYDLIQSWRTIHRHKCRISLLQRQLQASLSLCLHICILHQWVLCLQKLQVCYLVEVLCQDLPVRHRLVWSQAATGWRIWGWCCGWQLAWLAEKWPHSWHSRWSQHLFSRVLTEEQLEWTGHRQRGWGMSPCWGTLGVQWHLWVLGEHAQHQPSPGLGGHHWHHIGSQRSLWLGPLHMFSMGWTQLYTSRLPAWGYIDRCHVLPQCDHVQWCHQWFQYIQGTLQGTGPSSSGRCLVSRPDQREDIGSGTSQKGCWR